MTEEIEKVEREASSKQAEAERLRRLLQTYPDVRKHVGRWNKVAYCSKSVNAKVDHFDLRYNCGCCDDSPLEVWPYVETPNGNVYSDPPMFFIGERDPSTFFGDRLDPDWKDKLKEAGISDRIADAILTRFDDDARADDDGSA